MRPGLGHGCPQVEWVGVSELGTWMQVEEADSASPREATRGCGGGVTRQS